MKFLKCYKNLAWAKKFGQKYADEHQCVVRIEIYHNNKGSRKCHIEVWKHLNRDPEIQVIRYVTPINQPIRRISQTGTMGGQTT